MEWNGMEYGMEWNGMEWNMEWNGMEWNGMEWNGMEYGMEWNETWNGMEWNGMEWNGMEWNGMEWNMEWNGMEWNGMEWNGMEWNGMEYGMEWNETWNGMEWNEGKGDLRHRGSWITDPEKTQAVFAPSQRALKQSKCILLAKKKRTHLTHKWVLSQTLAAKPHPVPNHRKTRSSWTTKKKEPPYCTVLRKQTPRLLLMSALFSQRSHTATRLGCFATVSGGLAEHLYAAAPDLTNAIRPVSGYSL